MQIKLRDIVQILGAFLIICLSLIGYMSKNNSQLVGEVKKKAKILLISWLHCLIMKEKHWQEDKEMLNYSISTFLQTLILINFTEINSVYFADKDV